MIRLLKILIPLFSVMALTAPQNPVDNGSLRWAAERGDARAANLLGYRYYLGMGLTADRDSALFWLNKAAESGYGPALANLGYLYATGIFGDGMDSIAVNLLEAGVSQKVPEAMVNLSDLYLQGHCVVADTVRAEHLLAEAAALGLDDALLRLDYLVSSRPEPIKADTLGLSMLGNAYAFGRVFPYDPQVAVDYYLRAALRGHSRSRRIIAEELGFFPDALNRRSTISILKAWFATDTIPPEVFTSSWWSDSLSPLNVSWPDAK